MPDTSSPARFVEVADRVWVARHEWFDVNVSLVGGSAGLLMVDTHASASAVRETLAAVRALDVGEVVAVVNTHEHFDHTFGNGEVLAAYGPVPVHAHETAAERTVTAGDRVKALYAEDPDDPRGAEVVATEVVPADRTFSSTRVVDLGDRVVELVHPGRGHTGGDAVVRVADADVLLAGDLVEESALRNGVPGFGEDCYPLEWPLTLDVLLQITTPSTTVVPGHGAPVGRDFVEDQRAAIGVVAETIRDLASRGVPVGEALAAGEWPYPREELAAAVRRGYEHLPRSQKRLPLI